MTDENNLPEQPTDESSASEKETTVTGTYRDIPETGGNRQYTEDAEANTEYS